MPENLPRRPHAAYPAGTFKKKNLNNAHTEHTLPPCPPVYLHSLHIGTLTTAHDLKPRFAS